VKRFLPSGDFGGDPVCSSIGQPHCLQADGDFGLRDALAQIGGSHVRSRPRWLATAILFGVSAIASNGYLWAAPQSSPPAADNTKANEANRTTTADQAKNDVSDRDIMQRIRKSLMDEKSLSTYAHNVKIISKHGQVTLKGPVRSDEEKRIVEQKANEVAGAGNVNSQITIKLARHS
jgi:hyperosmotically inducible periplasmic protein